MTKSRFCLLILIGTLCTMETYAQRSEVGDFVLETRGNRGVRMDFELFNNLVVVPVIVNNSRDTLKLVLDTGVAKTLITGLPNGEEINLNFTETIRIAGLGEGESIEAFYSQGNRVVVDQTTGSNQEILVLKEDIFNLSTLLGTYVHGLIGHSIFKDFIVEIDYGRDWIKFHDHGRFEDRYMRKKNSNDWSTLPLKFRNDKPYVDVEIEQKDGSRVPLTLLIDTGASHALSLYHSANDKIFLPDERIRSFLGNGLSGEIKGYWGRVEKLHFGDYTFEGPVSSYPDEEGILRAIVYSSRDGSIGAEIMKRFKVMFNYRDSSMIFQPSKYFEDDFSYNMAGIEVATPFPEIQLYEVAHVREGSIAEREGIQVGDYITELNGESSSKYTMNEVLKIFQGDEGLELSFKMVRDDSTFRKRFTMYDELE